MIIKTMTRHTTQTQSFHVDCNSDGTFCLCFRFNDVNKRFEIVTVEDLGRLLQVLVGCEELNVVCKGELALRHRVDPTPGYWFTIGPGSAGKCPQDCEFAFRLTPAEALVLTEVLRDRCSRMMGV